VNLDRIGAELFGWLIMAVALLMAGDWIVANRFYAPRGDQPARVGDADATAATPPQLQEAGA